MRRKRDTQRERERDTGERNRRAKRGDGALLRRSSILRIISDREYPIHPDQPSLQEASSQQRRVETGGKRLVFVILEAI